MSSLPLEPLLDVSTSSHATAKLMRWLAATTLFCLFGGLFFYLSTSLSEDVSQQRRSMNASAYTAQVYFDKREALLSLLGSSTAATKNLVETQANSNTSMQLLTLGGPDSPWSLYLSDRALSTLTLFTNNLIYVEAQSPHRSTVVLSEDTRPSSPPVGVQAQLARLSHLHGVNEHAKIHWLADENDSERRLYLFTRVGPTNNPAGWLGLELKGPEITEMLQGDAKTNYLLIDNDYRLSFGDAVAPAYLVNSLRTEYNDTFEFVWHNGLPRQIMLKKSIGEDGWQLVFYRDLFSLLADIATNIYVAAAACIIGLLLFWLLLHRFQRQLIEPAERYHQQLIDSLDFGGTLIQMTPIGLCVIRRHDDRIILDNQLTRQWLGQDASSADWHGNWRSNLMKTQPNQDEEHGPIKFITSEGRHLEIRYAEARYQGDDVLICAFTDISTYLQAEAALASAKQAADETSQAKTQFLATMSHEIRTPLYGVIGTLELLGLTTLTPQQQQYLRTIQYSSSTLLQLINDVLDVSKIEAGQITLETTRFSPLELTETTLQTYANTARQKNLQIFVCTDSNLPGWVYGDATRIRQVLGNLINNAIKLTDTGRVFLRVQVEHREQNQAVLSWQVIDTGRGISQADQKRLFEPFYQVKGSINTVAGTGLGLAICAQLVNVMNGRLDVISELGLGSSFSVTLPLKVKNGDWEIPHPDLAPTPTLYLRCKAHELRESAYNWLTHWGAWVKQLNDTEDPPESADGILIDLLVDEEILTEWTGPHIQTTRDGTESPQHKGNLWVVSLFSIQALANAVSQAQHGAGEAPVIEETEPSPLLLEDQPSRHVLLVEDNVINQMIMKDQLRLLGCQVTIAGNGIEALREWHSGKQFDLILTDVNMPGMDGYELVRKLREEGCTLPILGSTASATPSEKTRCLEAGMDDCLIKPLDLKQLKAILS